MHRLFAVVATAIFQKFVQIEIARGILKKTETELFELTYILLSGISETKVCDVLLNIFKIPMGYLYSVFACGQ